MLRKGKQILLHMWHPLGCLYITGILDFQSINFKSFYYFVNKSIPLQLNCQFYRIPPSCTGIQITFLNDFKLLNVSLVHSYGSLSSFDSIFGLLCVIIFSTFVYDFGLSKMLALTITEKS